MNIYEQQASNRRMTWAIMFVFVVFFVVIGLGFDFFYLSFNPVAAPEYKYNPAGYYEAAVSSQPVPYGTIVALLIGFGMVINSMVNGPAWCCALPWPAAPFPPMRRKSSS